MRVETGRSRDPRRGRRRGASAAMSQASVDARPAAPAIRLCRARVIPILSWAMEERPTVLLVDDEESVQKVLTYPLEREGYRVVQARDGEQALDRYRDEHVDLVILDLMLPRLDGLAVCRRLREERSAVPIIMLTARGDEGDKVLGLELGADDYITKPFSIREFMSRVRALLRRAQLSPVGARAEVIEVEGLSIDMSRRTVEARAEPVQLTFLEFELLRMLAGSPGRVFTRKELLDELWGGSEFRDPRTIDVHVRHLREKVERDPAEPGLIFTVRGAGYRFRDTP